MLKCVELKSHGVDTYHLPLVPETAPRLHGPRGQTSLVVGYATRSVTFAEQPAALSIKCSFAGPVNYVVGGRRMVVQEDRYLVVNHNRPYSSYVNTAQPVNALSVFFGKPFVDEVLSSRARSEQAVLERPSERLEEGGFFENLYPYDQQLLARLRQLYHAHQTDQIESDWLVERLHELLGTLTQVDDSLRTRMAAMPSAKASTRREIFRRVCEARDYIDSNYTEPLSLDDLAGHVCMSPHHFLRSFKSAVGQTPHNYLLEVRLTRAHRLLAVDDLPVAVVAEAVGFESWEHFSRSFRRRFGTSPGGVRPARRVA